MFVVFVVVGCGGVFWWYSGGFWWRFVVGGNGWVDVVW